MKTKLKLPFWYTFAEKYWEKKPLLVKKFQNPILEIDQIEIFKMLVAFANCCRKSKSAEGFKLFVDGHILNPAEVLQFLPLLADRTLTGYNSRMETYFSDYCLVCDELLQTNQKKWAQLHDFTSTLFSYVGVPNRFVEMGLYLGNYRKTPFGVHVDGCGVFSFPVVGKKTFRLWKPGFGQKNKSLDRSQNYNRFKKHSSTLQAEHGDMTYWPSSAWHIAESDGSFNATWSLGVWVDKTHSDSVEQALQSLLKTKHGNAGNSTTTSDASILKNGEVALLPKNFLQSIRLIKNLTTAELHDAFMKDWLRLLSTHGFRNSYNLGFSAKLSLNSRLQLPVSKKIFWTQMKSKRLVVYAFEGVSVECSPSKNIQKLVNVLNSGQPCSLSDYLIGNQKTVELKVIQKLLNG